MRLTGRRNIAEVIEVISVCVSNTDIPTAAPGHDSYLLTLRVGKQVTLLALGKTNSKSMTAQNGPNTDDTLPSQAAAGKEHP